MWEYNHTDELSHYGIKGMKWGIRRFQDKKGRLTNAGKTRYNKEPESDDENTTKREGLTDKQKRAIKIGTVAVATTLAAYGGYKLYKSGKLDSLIETGREKFKKTSPNSAKVNDLKLDSSIGKLKKLSHKETVEDAISKANPTGSHNNCYNCVSAVVGRLCGLDVTAKTDTQGGKGMHFDDICRAFKLNPDNETEVRRMLNPSVDKISNVIGRKYQEGDVGAIAVSWNDSYKKMWNITGEAAHTLNWTVKNGKVEFMDGQSNIGGDKLLSFLNNYLDSGKEVSIAKLANINDDPSDIMDVLTKFVD